MNTSKTLPTAFFSLHWTIFNHVIFLAQKSVFVSCFSIPLHVLIICIMWWYCCPHWVTKINCGLPLLSVINAGRFLRKYIMQQLIIKNEKAPGGIFALEVMLSAPGWRYALEATMSASSWTSMAPVVQERRLPYINHT